MDYVKIYIKNANIEHLEANEQLDFVSEINQRTGEIYQKRVAEYHFCKITIYETGSVHFTGSLHKLWNSLNNIKAPNYRENYYKGFNGNLFALKDVLQVRDYLVVLLGCQLYEMVFQNVEFGVNVPTIFKPREFIKGLLYHKGLDFEFKDHKNRASLPHQRYVVKIYNKSYQYGMSENTLRIELQIKKMEELKYMGLRTFADINKDTFDKAKSLILKRFDEVIYCDPTINRKALTIAQKRNLNKYSNPMYWIDNVQPNHRDRHKKSLEKMNEENSLNLRKQIREDLIEKCVIINQHF